MSEVEQDILDMFAGVALAELLKDDLPKDVEKQMGYEWACKYAYIIAQRMMKERLNAHHASQTA